MRLPASPADSRARRRRDSRTDAQTPAALHHSDIACGPLAVRFGRGCGPSAIRIPTNAHEHSEQRLTEPQRFRSCSPPFAAIRGLTEYRAQRFRLASPSRFSAFCGPFAVPNQGASQPGARGLRVAHRLRRRERAWWDSGDEAGDCRAGGIHQRKVARCLSRAHGGGCPLTS